MKTLLPLVFVSLVLTACVDTTGLSAESSREPKGNPDAFVTVTEYADLQCPACAAAYPSITEPLIEQYGNRIRFEYKHFPLSQHQYAMSLAEAAECAADQGKFWEYIDSAFTNQPTVSARNLRQWAADLGLDMDLFDRCTKSHIKRDTIQADYDEGSEQGVQGTPTFFVNGKKVESSLTAIGAAIDAALSGEGQRL